MILAPSQKTSLEELDAQAHRDNYMAREDDYNQRRAENQTVAEEQKETCSVCLDELGGERLEKELSCGHKLHVDCAAQCIAFNNKCPGVLPQ